MLNRIGLGLVLAILSAGPALAQESCAGAPIPPVLPTVADIQSKAPAAALAAKHGAFEDIKRWQGDLKSYRDCLDASTNSEKRALANEQQATKPDKDKISNINGQMAATNHDYEVSVDTEEKVVNDFHAVTVAYCGRSDVDKSTCPKT